MSTFESKDSVFPSLTNDELEALSNLDQSIQFHETFSDSEEAEPTKTTEEDDFEDTCSELSEDNSLTFTVPQSYHQFKLPAIPESHESNTDFHAESKESRSEKKINAGYILFDGSEIKYVSHKTGTMDSQRATSISSDRFSSLKSRTSTTTQASDSIPINFYISADDLLGQDFVKNVPAFSLTPYSRLPTNSHFSLREKLYFFLIGVACVISFNSIYISVAFFRGFLGNQVLPILGSCHFASLLVAMAMVFLGKKTWFQFIPTITASFVLMAGVAAVFPILAVLRISYPNYVIYILVTLNGLCSGFGLAAADRMAILFPGGKSCLLFRVGGGFGCVLPAIIQMTAILIDCNENQLSEILDSIAFDLYIVFPVAFLAIFLGFISAIKLGRSGIYGLFADIENSFDNPRWMTISSSASSVIKQRCQRLAGLLLAEFLVAGVTWYSLSVAQIIHVKTLEDNSSNKSPFWTVHQTTVLLGIFQFGDIIGSLLGSLSRCCFKSLARKFLNGLHLLFSLLRIGCVVAIVLFVRTPYLVYNNIFMMVLYFVLAVTNGFLLVGMAMQSLSLCELQKDSCPVISQITWLAVQAGCLVGVGFSFFSLS